MQQFANFKTQKRYGNTSVCQKLVLLFCILTFSFSVAFSQVSVTATSGTMGPTSYANVNAAFTAINAGTHQGVITVSITGNTTEPATPVPLLKSTAPSNYSSVSIKPSGGNWTINSAATPTASRGIIELSGADNVTIDGDDPGTSGTQNLTIQSVVSSSTGIACVRFSSNSTTGTDGADNNTLKNCILIGSRNSATSTTSGYGFIMSNASSITTGAYSSLNTRVENNNISRCYHGINLSGASSSYPNTGTQVLNNVIGNATDANAVGQRGISITYSAVSSGGAIISGNDIRVGVSATGFSSTVAGIEIGTVNYGITISKNNIHDIYQPVSGGYGAHGIYITGSSNNTLSYIENNFIRDCKMVVYQTSATSTFIPCGVFFTAGATGVNFRHNTVSMSTQLGSGSNFSSFCVNASVSGVVFTTFQNNILQNSHTSTSAYCFYTAGTGNISGGSVDNNDYYAPGGNVGYYSAANRTTLSAWQTATGKDANAANVNPPFISSSDLHLDIANANISAVEQKGATGTGITTDIDGNTRPNSGTTLPDMGADEVAVPTCTAAAGGTISPASQNKCVGQTASMTAVGAETGMGISYQWEISLTGGGAGFADVIGGSGATTNSYTTDVLTAGTFYYRLRVTCTPASVTGYSNELTVVVYANPTAGVSPSAPTTCGGSPVTLTASGGSTYSWSPATGLNLTNSDVVVASPSVSTTYTVAVTNAAGCTATTAVTVTVVPGVGATASATPVTVCSGGSTQLNVAASQSFTTPPAASYTFDYQTGYTLQNMTGATSIVASAQDVTASAVTNIGFPFNFGGTNYTQFSASSNGVMGLGSSAVTSADGNNSTTFPTIIPAWDDMHTCTNGNVQYLLNTSGGTGNRILIVEWNYGNYAERTGTFTKKVQVWLYEGSNQIKIVYGANTGTGLTSATVGIVSASGNFNDVNTTTNTNNTASAQDANTVWPASGTAYVFTPTGGPAFTYAWTEAPSGTTLAATNIANPMATGILATTTYTVVVTGNGGCTASSSAVVSAGAPLFVTPAATPAAICFGGSSTLSAGATGGGTPYSYLWDDAGGSTSASITVSPGVETTYHVTVTDNCGASTVGSVTVVVNSLPTVNVNPATGLICNPGGAPVVLTASGASSYAWLPTSGLTSSTGAEVSAYPTATTTYTVTGTDGNGCSATSSAVVTVSTALTSPMAAAFHNPFCIGSDLNLSSSVTYPGAYNMNNNSGIGFIDISGTGTSVGVLSDDSEHNIVLPSFTFNGNVYTSARLGNNGSIVLGSSSGEVTHANAALPSTAHSAGNVFLAPYWDDLDVQLGATAVTQTVGNMFIIQYTNSTHDAYTTGGITFQVQLNLTSGAIHFVYQDVIFGSATYDAGVSATIGIQYSSSSATQYSTGTASLVNGQSITFTPPSLNYNWTGPDSFSSALQNPTIIAATADAAGTYTVVFTSTAGCSASATVSVTTSNTAPVISDCPTVVSVDADPGNCTANASWTEPTAMDADNCQSGNYSFSSDYSPGASFNIGSTPVTYTATDGLATAYCTFNVVVTASPEVCDASDVDEDCDGLSDNDDPGATGQVLYYRDSDADTWGLMGDFVSACDAPSGYVFNDADCDDNNSEVNPEATEVCNEIDDDCNESIDEGVQFTFYFDNDSDNYGDPASSTLACTAPSGFVADNTDCNDNDVFTYPGALEVCDGVDQDCNAIVDNGVQNPYIPDLDGDGYGAGAGDIVWACSAPEGYVPNCYFELVPSCDCDDNNPDINPGAQEICNGGIDDDCDVDADDADASVTGQQSYYLDNDGDNYGAGDLIFSCSLPEDFWSSLNGDCDDFASSINPDAQETCNGFDDDCDFDIDDADASVTGQQSFYLDNDSDTYGAGDLIFSCSLPENPISYINGDCDDLNSLINPGAQEICNGGIDDDCDFDIDDADASVTGQDAYFPDNDGDTYGAGEPVFSCIQPEMTASDDGDCDDNSDAINPGATEECNGGVDDDCDGLIDDDDENVGGQNAYMADNDEDGYGAGDLLMACLQPVGYVPDCNFVPTLVPGCDCDDTDPLINPGASETCNETDDDCDGDTDEELQSTFYADTDNDGYGDPEASTLACTLPVGHVVNADDCDDAAASVNPGATEVCNETDDDCDLEIDEGVATTTYYADADGDGKGNPLVSVVACAQPVGYVSNNTDCDDNTVVPCPKPTATVTTNITDISAMLSWTGTNCASRYRLQYRQKTTPASAWIDVYVTSTNYELTGLLEGTNYQWRVGTVCTPGGTSVPDGYVVPLQFKTKYRVYPDADNDGYGDAGSGTVLVNTFPAVGYSIDHTDCNDAVFTTHPNATELCNGVDDDCDLVIDDGVVSPYFWYEDSDGDGLGNELVSLNACVQPSGYVSNSNDCDDNSNILFCAPPTGGSILDISATTVTISWSEVPCALRYTMQYRQQTIPASTWSTKVNVEDAMTTLTGLMPGTTYQFRVRSLCPQPNPTTSDWLNITFTTPALPMGLTEEIPALDINVIDVVNNEFTIYPNPSDGRFQISLVSEQEEQISVTITDGFGKLVQQMSWDIFEGRNIGQFDLSNLTNGVYQVQVWQRGLMQSRKVVIVK